MDYFSLSDIALFGPGPSSAHSLGPYRAGLAFRSLIDEYLAEHEKPDPRAEYGLTVGISPVLAACMQLYSTAEALCGGLASVPASEASADLLAAALEQMTREGGFSDIRFVPGTHIMGEREQASAIHPRSIEFRLYLRSEQLGERLLLSRRWYCGAGGLLADDRGTLVHHPSARDPERDFPEPQPLPFAFSSASGLLSLCRREDLSIHTLMEENEKAIHGELRLRSHIADIQAYLELCSREALESPGSGFNPAHDLERIKMLLEDLVSRRHEGQSLLFWGSAPGGELICAAALIGLSMLPQASRIGKEEALRRFFLSATAVAVLLGRGALSASFGGCMAQLGSAAAMAAAGLQALSSNEPAAVLGAAGRALQQCPPQGCTVRDGGLGNPCDSRAYSLLAMIMGQRVYSPTAGEIENDVRIFEDGLNTMMQSRVLMQGSYRIRGESSCSLEADLSEC